MLPPVKSPAELQIQRIKLASSYNELLDEFSSKDLRTVGNYTVGHLIGKGSFGKAYLASHKLINGSKVVLKSANKQDSNLAREIHHHRQFLHPHIARLYEVVVTESMVWLVLEFCPGNELYHYLLKNGPLPPTMVQKIFTQLVGAVSYVHQKSCVHRDLKLENILLDKSENVKLCDFGFTREYEGKSSYLQTWCGTVCYSAPEMLKGEKYAGEKVDVWSLGIILYALLCGELPFDEDNDTATKMKILKEEPKYPDFVPAAAKDLIILLLSKRPLLRPSLADVLTNQWLADWAPHQQAILKVQQPAPFTTQLETDTLERMRSAGVNIDAVIENVLSQRCDALAGWWALLLEKEDRKEKRRQRKRREREAEVKAGRRISTASGRLLTTTIKESDEERVLQDAAPITERGRSPSRTNGDVSAPLTPTLAVPVLETQHAAPRGIPSSALSAEKKLSSRPGSSSKRVSQLGPGVTNKRNSVLQVVTTDGTVLSAETPPNNPKRRYQPTFFAQLAHIKHWFKDPKKRGKALNVTSDASNRNLQRPIDVQRLSSDILAQRGSMQGHRSDLLSRGTHPSNRLSSNSSHRRLSSHSPAPLTPKSSSRRATSSNLRGRKSTSSSVSSIRSTYIQHHPSHSKASSISSASIGSPSNVSAKSINAARRRSSPNTSVKVLVGPPSGMSPNGGTGRTMRVPPRLNFPDAQPSPFAGIGPPSPGLMFAKRKRSVFKGPTLGVVNSARRRSDGSGVGIVSGSGEGTTERRSGEVTITEEDEDEIEEVDAFPPVEEGEREYVIEEGEDEDDDGFVDEHAPSPDELGQPHPLTKWELNA